MTPFPSRQRVALVQAYGSRPEHVADRAPTTPDEPVLTWCNREFRVGAVIRDTQTGSAVIPLERTLRRVKLCRICRVRVREALGVEAQHVAGQAVG